MKKLIPLLQNSQRDSRWSSILLGNNTNSAYNIGNYGCLITSFGNYIGETPQSINTHKEMFVVGGGDFIWSKCTSLGLTNIYTSPRYEDAVTPNEISKMKSFIDQGKPLITEVDFNPSTISEEQHYVLIIGYDDSGEFIILDPWTGSVVSLGVYGGVNRAVYCYRVYDKVLAFDTGALPSTDECPAKLVQITAERDRLNGIITGKDTEIENLKNQNTTCNASLASLTAEKNSLSVQLTECQKQSAIYLEAYNQLPTIKEQLAHLEETKKAQAEEISELTRQVGYWTTKYNNLKKPGLKFIQSAVIGICEKLGVTI